jgi:opacity protein-like surface antigen
MIVLSYNQKGELMKKLVLVAVFLLGFSVMAMAQDVPAVEIFGGYSLVLVDTTTAAGAPSGNSLGLNGWDASVAFNGNKWLGFVADFGGYYGTLDTSYSYPPGVKSWADISIHSIMVGPKFTLHRGAVAPFVHALFGYARIKARELGDDYVESDFAMALGGGLDVNLSSRVSIRPAQLDLFTTKSATTGGFADHFRFSTGFVLKLGKR